MAQLVFVLLYGSPDGRSLQDRVAALELRVLKYDEVFKKVSELSVCGS